MKSFPQIYKVACHSDHIGPGSTFVAIKGFTYDGLTYIPDALSKGATTVVVGHDAEISPEMLELIGHHQATLVYVPSPRKALAEYSAHAYDHPAKQFKLIGITGTKGKTTTSYLLHHILTEAGAKVALLGTIKNVIGDTEYVAPLTTPQPDYLQVFFDRCRSEGVEYVIMEVAAQALSMHRLDTLTFDAVGFTNFSMEHAEFYGSMDEYFAAKCALFEKVTPGGLVVLNEDDHKVASCVPTWTCKERISMKGNGTITGTVNSSTLDSLVLTLSTKDESCELQSCMLGEFSGYNILFAYAFARRYGISLRMLQQALLSFKGVPGRIARYQLPNGAIALIDNAHTPSSYEAFFKAVRPLSDHIVAVFGAGGDRDAIKRPLMGAIAEDYADEIILTTDNPRSEDPAVIVDDIMKGITGNGAHVTIELDREKAIRDAYARTKKGSLLVLLGKGPVEYQHIQDKKIPFSEKAILDSLRS